MMRRLSFLVDFATYYITAQNRHHIHSDFFYRLTNEVINNNKQEHAFNMLENLHSGLKQNNTVIPFTDFGAGRSHSTHKQLTVSAIAKNSAKPARYARLMYRLVHHFKPQQILELGTSLGITTLYMAAASPASKIITLEGSNEVANLAEENFRKLKCDTIELVRGPFDETLYKKVQGLNSLDFVFFDGNHQKKPTLDYFAICLSRKTNNSVFVFDDINWSTQMKEAWETIKQHPDVYVTIDLFMMGLVFFNPDFSRQHFKLRF